MEIICVDLISSHKPLKAELSLDGSKRSLRDLKHEKDSRHNYWFADRGSHTRRKVDGL
jgi:hypothetical protein